MTDQERKAMEMALEALEAINEMSKPPMNIPLDAEIDDAMDALRQALAQPAWDASAPLVMTPHPAFSQNPLDIADRAYFAGKQVGIEEALAQPEKDRESDRKRFPDEAFNCWLDEGISDAGHTVWDMVGDIYSAWTAWDSRPFYDKTVEQEPVEPPSNQYNNKRIAWELERTAMGDGYYGNALYVAMDMAQTTQTDREVLHRYMHGSNLKTDHVKLQDLAMRIYTAPVSKQEPDYGIDRGAWSDVPNATKWVDELRGDEDSEQEPVAWDGDCVLGHCGSPDGCDRFGRCRAAPPSKPWVSLTDEQIDGFRSGYQSGRIGTFVELTLSIEAALKEKNNGL